jgi:hypothetical protein
MQLVMIYEPSWRERCKFDNLVDSQKGLFRFWVTERDTFVCDGQQWKYDVTRRYFSKNRHQRDADSSVCFKGKYRDTDSSVPTIPSLRCFA